MALTDGLTHLLRMETAGVESNLSPTPVAPLTLAESGTPPAIVVGKLGNARAFPTESENLSGTANSVPAGAGPLAASVAAWVNYDLLNGSKFGQQPQVALMEGSAGATTLLRFAFGALGDTDRAFLRVNQTSQVNVEVQGTTFGVLTVGQWHLIVGLMDGSGGTIGISVDNSAVNTAAWDGSMYVGSVTTMAVAHGNNFNSWHLDGNLDELAVWDRVLTTDEIAELWNGGDGVNILTAGGGGGGGRAFLRRRRRSF